MADFLTLNGWPVSVAPDATRDWDEIGGMSRAASGALRRTTSVRKRTWEMGTPVIEPQTAAALVGLLQSRGDVWSFDGSSYQLSGKGKSPAEGWEVARLAAQKVRVSQTVNEDLPKFGSHCIAVEAAATNLLSANQASVETDTTGFSAVDGATLTRDTGTYWTGAASLKCVTSAVVNGTRGGFQTAGVAVSPATAYTGSVYLRAHSGTFVVRLRVLDDTGAASSYIAVTLSSTAWTRVSASFTSGAGSPLCSIEVTELQADSGVSFYADGLQLEARGFATSWTAGGTTRPAAQLAYTLGELGPDDDLTVMCWTRGPNDTGASEARAWTIGSATDGVRLECSGTDVSAQVYSGGVQVASATKTSAWDGAWHHVAVVVRRSPTSGSYGLELHFDGALAASATPSSLPELSSPTLYVGTDDAGTLPLNGELDELVVLPWGATAEQVAAWSDRTFPFPAFAAGGEAIGPAEVRCFGQLAGYSYVPAGLMPWSMKGARIRFTLAEK